MNCLLGSRYRRNRLHTDCLEPIGKQDAYAIVPIFNRHLEKYTPYIKYGLRSMILSSSKLSEELQTVRNAV